MTEPSNGLSQSGLPGESKSYLQDLLRYAQKAGADAADLVFTHGVALSYAERNGKTERIERLEGREIGLRVFVGERQAMISTSDLSDVNLKTLAEQAVAMAKVATEDPFCGLASPETLAAPQDIETNLQHLDIYDPGTPGLDLLKERAHRCEQSALAVKGIINSEGAEAGWGEDETILATSDGFFGRYRSTRHSLAIAIVAGTVRGMTNQMESDYDFSSSIYGSDLETPEHLGRKVGERAVSHLNARKIRTARMPVIFDRRVSRSLLTHFSAAINGAAIASRTSFLEGKLHQPVFASAVQIIDDPLRRRGLRSRPFDAEGVSVHQCQAVQDGVLQTWLLDSRSARQLGLKSTGHAARGVASPPSPSATNFYMAAGKLTPDELIADIEEGLYVVQLIGQGVNGVTGDYSRGAVGFLIEKGKRTYPVSEITIAGNLLDMYRQMTPANDLEFQYGIDAPTVRIEGMMVAGR